MIEVSHLYKLTNQITGQYYIGKHKGWEQNGYWGSGIKLKYNQNAYGIKNFKYEILCYGSTKYILELEGKYVTQHLIESDNNCLNLIPGGLGIEIFTKELRKKLGDAKRGHQMYKDEKRNEKIRQALLGTKLDEARKNKIRIKAIGRKQSITQIEKRVEKIKKLIWINDGKNSYRILPELFDDYAIKGFNKGRIYKRKK